MQGGDCDIGSVDDISRHHEQTREEGGARKEKDCLCGQGVQVGGEDTSPDPGHEGLEVRGRVFLVIFCLLLIARTS